MLRSVGEYVASLDHLVETKPMGNEVLDWELMLGDQIDQHRECICVHETHRDVDFFNPQLNERELDRRPRSTHKIPRTKSAETPDRRRRLWEWVSETCGTEPILPDASRTAE